MDLDDGRVLHVLNLHLKSKIPTDVLGQKLNPADRFSPWRSAAGAAEGAFLSTMKRVGPRRRWTATKVALRSEPGHRSALRRSVMPLHVGVSDCRRGADG
ncbi:MAG TPA: hypothetical protein VE269_03720 [Gaiellaceae bacterium]|nr:hypothetical protein [Gaiellaceae bacterium]